MNDKLNKVKLFLYKYVEDILILGGLLFIVIATFLINYIAGIYTLGIVFIGLGIVFSKYPPKQRR